MGKHIGEVANGALDKEKYLDLHDSFHLSRIPAESALLVILSSLLVFYEHLTANSPHLMPTLTFMGDIRDMDIRISFIETSVIDNSKYR